MIQTTPVLFNIVRYLGAFYLLWLGGKMLWSVMMRQKNAHESSAEPASAILKRSLVLSLTNPKAILFYVSFFVQFIDVNAKNTGTSFLILATTLELISFMYMSFLIFSGAFVTRYLKTKKETGEAGERADRSAVCRICGEAGVAALNEEKAPEGAFRFRILFYTDEP